LTEQATQLKVARLETPIAMSLARFTNPRGRNSPEVSEAEAELSAARATFDRFIELEGAFDPAVVDLYADDGIVIERMEIGGVERRAREIPMCRYKAALSRALAGHAHAPESASHSQIRMERIAPGWVSVRTLRRSSASRAAAPYELVLRLGADGAWRIVKEMAVVAL
jgi:ketosteroid isomerase-like protein